MEPIEPTEPTDPGAEPGTRRGATVDWSSVLWGAGVGLVLIVVVATVRVGLDRSIEDFDESGWVLGLFGLILGAYFVAGWVAQQRAAAAGTGASPLTHGALAGLGAFVLWIPVRIGIWLARDEERGLLRGSDAALRPGQLFGGIVIAAGVGMLGGFVAGRVATRVRARSTPEPS
ncbi:MAG: hypothetical protein WDA60_05305 [Acidimicrobiia bacterium]